MKKTTSTYELKVTPLENREDHHHVYLKLGSQVIDAVLARETSRHLLEIWDSAIGTGLHATEV